MLNVYCVGLRDEGYPETFDSWYGLVRIAVARDEAHARELWRAIVPPGDGIDDVDSDDELLVIPLEWEWDKLPEPERPEQPCLWIPGGMYEGLEMWRGYGLANEDEDTLCEECEGFYPDGFCVDISCAEDYDTRNVCLFCRRPELTPWSTP